jgi:hypothetical protein
MAERNVMFNGLSILPNMAITLREITADFFRNTGKQVYRFQQPGGEGHVELELIEVTEQPVGAWPAGRAVPFSLVFRSVEKAVLQPGLAAMIHPEVEGAEMSLQRIMPPPGMPHDQVYYEAVFN